MLPQLIYIIFLTTTGLSKNERNFIIKNGISNNLEGLRTYLSKFRVLFIIYYYFFAYKYIFFEYSYNLSYFYNNHFFRAN